MRFALAAPKPSGEEDKKGGADAETCLCQPIWVVRYGLAEAEFQLAVGVVIKSPIAPDGAFKQPLPRLVEGLDEVHPPTPRLGRRHDAAQHARLIGGGGERSVAHPPRTRPPHLSDPNLLAGEGRLKPLPDLAHMGDRIVRRDRRVLPIGENVDGDEVGGRRKLGRLQPELPDIGIGDRQPRPLPHLLEISLDLGGRELAPEQHLVADDEGLDSAGMVASERKCRLDLAPVLGPVPPKPDPLQDLEPQARSELGHPPLRAPRRVGAHARSRLGKARKVARDLPVGNV